MTITDVDRDDVLAEFDTAALGADPDIMVRGLRDSLWFRAESGVVISDGVARALAPRPDLVFLESVGGRFVAMTGDETDGTGVWVSTDGIDWQSAGPPSYPSDGAPHMELLRRPEGDDGQPLVASVLIDEADTQRSELWSSTDGQAWRKLGLVYTYPEPDVVPILADAEGYLGIGEDIDPRL